MDTDMNHRIIFALLASVIATGMSDHEDGSIGGFFGRYPYLERLVRHGELTWAKPIETVDMDLIMSLIDSGFLSSKEAEWYVRVEEDQDD